MMSSRKGNECLVLWFVHKIKRREMSEESPSSDCLSFFHRLAIVFLLRSGLTPQMIIDSWNIDVHRRKAPSIQMVYNLRRKVLANESVEREKKGPKRRSVLSPSLLDQIEQVLEEYDSINHHQRSRQMHWPDTLNGVQRIRASGHEPVQCDRGNTSDGSTEAEEVGVLQDLSPLEP